MSKRICILILLLPVLALFGCTQKPKAEALITDSGVVIYNTDDSTDAMNYVTYVNKELDLVMNILSSHMANGNSIAKGDYIVEDEIDAVTESLVLIDEAIESVDTLNPPEGYGNDRLAILRRMKNAENTLEAYKEALESGKTSSIGDYVKLMEGDYVSLSGYFNVFWE